MAGLRPYRAPGFRVRAEALGDKRLVHNYGHGGAGITLSWGTSRLATLLGLQGHRGPVAVLGAGVMGLSTARLVAGGRLSGHASTPRRCRPTPPPTSPAGSSTRSAITTAQGHRAEWRAQFAAALDYSWRRFQIMVGDDYGIRWLPTYVETNGGPERQLLETFPPNNRCCGRTSIRSRRSRRPLRHALCRDRPLPPPADPRRRARRRQDRDPRISRAGRACRRCRAADVQLHRARRPRPVRRPGIAPGARPARHPLPQPEIQYAFTGDAGYMFPRADGILLGGTFELDQWDATPQPETIARIIASHQRLFASLRCTAKPA
jgi:D-amino-acid oxidase